MINSGMVLAHSWFLAAVIGGGSEVDPPCDQIERCLRELDECVKQVWCDDEFGGELISETPVDCHDGCVDIGEVGVE